MLTAVAFGLLAAAGLARGQAVVPTSTTDSILSTTSAQYDASGFNTAIGNSLAFGFPLQATAQMTVVYGGQAITNGQALTAAQVAAMPQIYITPSAAAATAYTAGTTFTLTLADAAALGNPDREGFYRHYLANSVMAVAGQSAANVTFVPSAGTVITNYAGPGPAAGEGPHRYAWLMFAQPANFAAPAGLNAPNTAPGHWNLPQYKTQANLGNLVAASFFTVANGQATYAVPSTSSVAAAVAATTAAGSTTAAPAGGGAVSSAAARPSSVVSSAAAAATSARTGGAAISAAVAPVLSALAAVAVGFVALA